MMSSSGRSSSNNVYPFTTTQWQELEHQALVFKYMISGLQIPQDLLFTIRRSLDDSSLSSKLLLHHPPPPPPPPQHMSIGWNAYHHQQQQMGLGYHHHRKIDAEPGRCRRTDGKKWRCSREAYTDSKYCERHMHRGRNRSRKPVENTILSSPPPTTKPSPNSNTNPAIPTTISNNAHHSSSAQSHFLYSHNTLPSSSGIPLPSSSQQCTTKFFMESNPYRNSHGRETDEHRFLSSEINSSNGGVNDSSLKMGSSALFQMKENSSAYNPSGLENWQQQLQSLTRQHNHHDYCCNNSYSSYYDHHMRPPLSIDDGEEADHQHQTKKVMHHFLDSWPDSEDHRHHKSVPNSLHDFFMTEKW